MATLQPDDMRARRVRADSMRELDTRQRAARRGLVKLIAWLCCAALVWAFTGAGTPLWGSVIQGALFGLVGVQTVTLYVLWRAEQMIHLQRIIDAANAHIGEGRTDAA